MLIDYLEKLSGKGDKNDFLEASNISQTVVPKSEISQEELDKILKKDKLTVLVSKRENSETGVFGGSKKGGKKTN